MKRFMQLLVLGASLMMAFSVSAADLKNCRYSKAKGEDQYDNQRVSSASCNSRLCVGVVVCDNDKSVSNVVCAMGNSGCPSADQCVKEMKANGIKFAQQTSTEYKAPATPPVDNGGSNAR